MAPRGGGCLYFIMEWPGIIRSGLFLSLYNQWLAGSWGDVLIRVKRCGNKEMRIFCTILTWMIVLQRLVRGGEAGARQRQVSPCHLIRHWTLAFCLPSCRLVLIVYTGPPYWNSILLHLKLFLGSDRACEYYSDRWDLRFTSRFEAKIFISGWKNVSTCRIKLLFFCLGIKHKSLFLWKSFFQLFPNLTVKDKTIYLRSLLCRNILAKKVAIR